MKFKVGDKVRLKKGNRDWVKEMDEYIGKEAIIQGIRNDKIDLHGIFWTWYEDGIDDSCSQEYFYVGQTVYSPLFHNKERKAVIENIDKLMTHPILCKGYNVNMSFRLDGKYIESQDFVSLFQEPIQFPVNKPIETFEEGEIVEYSNDGVHWGLGYYVGIEKGEEHQYKVCTFKGMHDKLDSYGVWAKIKKFK